MILSKQWWKEVKDILDQDDELGKLSFLLLLICFFPSVFFMCTFIICYYRSL